MRRRRLLSSETDRNTASPTESAVWRRRGREHSGADRLNAKITDHSSRTYVRLGAWFWSAKADIFFSESLHILAERLSQSEIELPLRKICYYSSLAEVGVSTQTGWSIGTWYLFSHLPSMYEKHLLLRYDHRIFKRLELLSVGSSDYVWWSENTYDGISDAGIKRK